VASFQSSFASDAPASYRGFAGALQLLSLRLSSLLSLDCWSSGGFSFFDDLLARTLLPVGVGVAIVGGHVALGVRAGDLHTGERRSRLLRNVLFSCFFFFPGASTAAFQTFNRDDDFDGGDCWLRADYSLSCRADDATYARFRAWAALMVLVYPVGIPVFFLALVWRHRALLARSPEQVCEALAAQGRAAPEDMQAFADDWRAQASLAARSAEAEAVVSRSARALGRRLVAEAARREATGSAVLFEAYRPDVWWWEVSELARRLLLSGALVFAWPGTARQAALAVLVALWFVLASTWLSPYLTFAHNRFTQALQWALLAQLFGVLLLRSSDASVQGSAGGVLGGLMVACGLANPETERLLGRGQWRAVERVAGSRSRPRSVEARLASALGMSERELAGKQEEQQKQAGNPLSWA